MFAKNVGSKVAVSVTPVLSSSGNVIAIRH